jgi:hypothetical protein
MLTRMTDEDWSWVLEVFRACCSRRQGPQRPPVSEGDLRSNVDFPEVGDGVGGHSGLLVFEDHAVTRDAGRLRRG